MQLAVTEDQAILKIFPSQEHLVRRLLAWLAHPTKPTAAQDVAEFGAAIGSSVGEVREENQDRAVIARFARFSSSNPDSESNLLFAVCDGMGGLPNGARCAEIAIAHLITSIVYSDSNNPRTYLADAIQRANREVYGRFKGRGGTTIAAVLLSKDQVVAGSVGDSRIYTIEGNERVRQISSDDTIAGEVSRAKGVDAADLRLGHLGSGLAQYVGMGEGIEPRIYELKSVSDQMSFCLTSDGAHSVAAPVFDRVVGMAPNPYACVTRLLQLSRWCGGLDNATVVIGTGDGLSVPGGLLPQQSSGIELWDSYSKLELVFDGCPEAATKVQPPQIHSPVREPAVSQSTKPRPPAYPMKESKKKRKRDRPESSNKKAPAEPHVQARLEIEIKPGDSGIEKTSAREDDTVPVEKSPERSETGNAVDRPPEDNGNGSL
jgi:serine/threonine protein phosphatase PrpC